MRRGAVCRCVALVSVIAVVGGACLPAAAEGRPPAVAQPLLTFEQKMAWILMLEDRRVLQDTRPFPPLPPPPAARGKKAKPAPPPPMPSLVRLIGDAEARVRRRAALAVGRVGVLEGVAPLADLLAKDPEPEVRQMAAFALGLIGRSEAAGPLRTALADPSPLVHGRAAEALGAVGDRAAAEAVARTVAAYVTHPAVAGLAPGDERHPAVPEAEAFRLALYALARLKAADALVSAVLHADGTPRVRWWPVAFALARVEDPRAVPGLLALARASDAGIGRAFAARGLGVLKTAEAVPVLSELAGAWRQDPRAAVQALRSLGQIATPACIPPLRAIARLRDADPNIRLEAVSALGAVRDPGALDIVLDLLSDAWPAMRAAALRAAAAIDPDNFLTVLSSLDTDPHIGPRIALASVLADLPSEQAAPRLRLMTGDADPRVVAAAIAALARIKAPDLGTQLLAWLRHEDMLVRAAAASALGELEIDGAAGPLAQAYRDGATDPAYQARAAALAALRRCGPTAAVPVLREALADKDWAVRVRAAALLRELDPRADVAAMRPGPGRPDADYTRASVLEPAVSPHVYLETDKGTVEVELYVLDAPQTSENFLKLAREGFFTGVPIHRVVSNFVVQHGDPRGDGEGGPGYTIRDEINQRPYVRGTVGMALDWADTGGSQWFVTHSPQPHLDGRYTVFGHVIAGLDVVDRLQQWDVIRRVRTWDGTMLTTR